MVRKVKRNEFEGVVFPAETDVDGNPSGFKFSLLASGGRRPIDVNEIVKRYESRIAMSVLGEFVLLGMDSVGSFSLSSNKTHLFSQAIGSYLQQISEVFTQFAIPKLLKYNGVPPEYFPRLAFEDIETPDLNELAGAIGTLSSAGVLTPDDELEKWVRDFGNMPMPDVSTGRESEELQGETELPTEEEREQNV
jgi:phage gp29-like protein